MAQIKKQMKTAGRAVTDRAPLWMFLCILGGLRRRPTAASRLALEQLQG